MRFLLPAVAACLVLSTFAVSIAMTLAAPLSGTTTPTPVPASGAGAMPAAAASDDAAKHARRTNCLKQAKTKKLVGAQKTAFIKDCVGTP